MKRGLPEDIAAMENEMAEWEGEIGRFQGLLPTETKRDQLKLTEVPELEASIKQLEAEIPEATEKSDSVRHLLTILIVKCLTLLYRRLIFLTALKISSRN